MKKRNEIPVSDTWNLEDLLPGREAWEELYQKTNKRLEGYEAFAGRLGDSAGELYNCLAFDDDLSRDIELLYVYSRMALDQDTRDKTYQEMFGRAQGLSNLASEKSAFITPEILALPKERIWGFLDEHEPLKQYRRVIEQILYKQPHVLSKAMEELLAGSYEATQGAAQIFSMFNNADVRFPAITDHKGKEVPVTHGSFISLMENPNQQVRRDAFSSLYSVYRQFQNTVTATYQAQVKQAVFYAKARNYPSSRAHSLAANEIPEQVYDQLVATVRKHLHLMHRYVRIRKQALGVKELHMYDLYTPMVKDVQEKYSFAAAKEMVREGLKPLGEEYLAILQEGFLNRWIDVYENEGKRSGAYSWGAYGTHPYVLLNYQGNLNDVFTLAHEMGHAIHSYYSDKHQPFTYAGYKIFVAEVASTCNEALLIHDLLKKTTEKPGRKYLLNHFLDSFRSTLFRQTMFAEFEAMVHSQVENRQTLTAAELAESYKKLNRDYYGPEMVVDDEIGYEWERIPHFYTPFYVYQYATGYSAAIAISAKILAGDEAAINGYRRFLKSGSTMPPVELLKLAGVDMSSRQPIEDALFVFASLLDEYESIDKR